MARTRILLAVVVAGVVLVAGCSSADDDSASADRSEDAVADESATTVDAGESADDGAAGDGGDGVATVDVDLAGVEVDRDIVYRGDVASEVDDVAAAVGSARAEVGAEGGYVFGQEVTDGRAHVVLKVPSARFDAAFDAVAAIGDVTSTSIEADDVTEQFTDLESRRSTLEASIARLRGFLAASTNVDEISRLESELTRREAERDVIAGQLRVLEDRTSFGTISATFTAVGDEAVAAPVVEDGPPGFARGLEVGADAVVFAAGITATATGFLLPFLPLLLLAGGLLWWRRRRSAVPASA